jgi:hypothetical protein
MIQLNLLPDIKLQYVKSQRTRRLLISVSVLVTAVAIAILALLLLVDLAQKEHLNSLNKSIQSNTQTLKNKPDINKILTVQNQLESLTALHSQKPAVSNLFTSYLDQITPAKAAISDLDIDFGAHTISITGTADSLATIDQYVDTLKFTTYTTNTNSSPTKAFSSVVLSSFGLSDSTDGSLQTATYNITTSYDPTIFDITKTIKINVPSEVTTRSEQAQPTDLFQTAPSNKTTTEGQ